MGWKAWLLAVSLVLVGGAVVLPALLEGEYRRAMSPDGRYTAIATYPLVELALPRFAGQSGDKSGYIRIEGADGTDYGKIPVAMVSMIHDIRWGEQGASLVAIGAWDFAHRTYAYWTEDQTREVTGRAD